jgi:molecular chaperone DnaK
MGWPPVHLLGVSVYAFSYGPSLLEPTSSTGSLDFKTVSTDDVPMSKIVGMDLGTTNSLVALVDMGLPFVISDSDGHTLTPSVVHFPAAKENPWVGIKARRIQAAKPQETVYSIKRFMGRRSSEVTENDLFVTYPLNRSGSGPVQIPIHGKNFSPEEISSFILQKLKKDAETFLGEEVKRAVITVPAYFNDAQRNATKKAGELAGLTVERIINEPTAAALAYGLQQLHSKSKIAVYDLGGGTFDISILELHEGTFQVLASHGDTRLGGDDIDQKISEHIIDEIIRAHPQLKDDSSSPAFLARIREVAEIAKCELSEKDSYEVRLPFLASHISFSTTITRAKLEDLSRGIIDRTKAHCLRCLADAKLEPKDLSEVILVGGQTRMPLVRRVVQDIFQREPNTRINPDEAVALGAAVQGEILSGGFQNVLLLDVTPLSLGIETFGGLMNVIIPRNTTIPAKAGELFTTAVDYQKSMLIHVLQGEREIAKDNWSLGKFTLDFESAPKGVPRVGVQFEIDANGILHVLARDVKSGKERIVEIQSAIDVSDEAVEKMLEESFEHAFEDINQRRWIDAKLKAHELLKATDQALKEVQGKIPPSDLKEIEAAKALITSALSTESKESQVGDLQKLKAAMTELDASTQTLAALLIESLISPQKS